MISRNQERRVLTLAPSGPAAVFPLVTGLILLLLALLQVPFAAAADPYATENELATPELNHYLRERHQRAAAEQQERFRIRVPVRDAVGDNVLAAYMARQKAKAQTPDAPPLPSFNRRALLFTAIAFVALILLVRKLAPELFVAINKKFNPWAQTVATVADLSAQVRAEDEAFSAFVNAFRTGPGAVSSVVSGDAGGAAPEHGLLMEFFATAPRTVSTLQKFIQEIGQGTGGLARQRLLADLHRELRTLKGAAGLPELLPVWQMASALEGLVKQLSGKANDVTPSTLRTVSEGVDLLKDLCVPGLQADLLANPPIRLLAVDDDLISRNAVKLALKKAFDAPDLAETGEAALALATEHAYDMIFLDIQMPGMDGFEVCTRIRGTVTNSTAPVVFVTCSSDFEARAKSILCGGNDLISKPFLTFEITVKALTLILQDRLSRRAQIATLPEGRDAASSVSAGTPPVQNSPQDHDLSPKDKGVAELASTGFDRKILAAGPNALAGRPVSTGRSAPAQRPRSGLPKPKVRPEAVVTSENPSSKDLLQAFLARASTNLPPLRDLIQTLFRITDDNLRQEMLADFFLRFNALAPQAVSGEEHPALRLCTALEGLLTKMLGNPQHCTSSTLLTVASAVDLLIELCEPGVRPNLVTEPPIQLLVVDDDPVARRAVTGALQMSFEKPENVDSGEAALRRAVEKPFDAIFLDVEMPGMDGFAACMKIRETERNRTTPVVFVTCHSDFKARSQSAISGGSDLIAKPFLPAEIKAKALTFIMRGRLQQGQRTQIGKRLSREEASKQEVLVPA